jgi:hypothetical protein
MEDNLMKVSYEKTLELVVSSSRGMFLRDTDVLKSLTVTRVANDYNKPESKVKEDLQREFKKYESYIQQRIEKLKEDGKVVVVRETRNVIEDKLKKKKLSNIHMFNINKEETCFELVIPEEE